MFSCMDPSLQDMGCNQVFPVVCLKRIFNYMLIAQVEALKQQRLDRFRDAN